MIMEFFFSRSFVILNNFSAVVSAATPMGFNLVSFSVIFMFLVPKVSFYILGFCHSLEASIQPSMHFLLLNWV